ncbi:XRE family transcriptional regulator [Marinobacter sp. NP-4(2019)]|uniref:helix-turn-helix domain-containing protein n=1 Tax=Marinobacter sp. NP-4(2019) TaxID=2488665 RepID=UPI000FC3CC61|nr:helix-turn-helix transcriptional regulator [Marinobacter sp. NP-4(2019)]AZT83238.1 XRE family transcriptional regulator [Marinobacter sp. NP-4(2019)]
MASLLTQLKKRRLEIGLKQHDMMMRVGMSRQQYQRLESRGNPRLDTLELIAKGLKSELVLVPQEKLQAVMAILEGEPSDNKSAKTRPSEEKKPLSDDPWQGLLGDIE